MSLSNKTTITDQQQFMVEPVWLTGEVFVFSLIGLLALGLRLANLAATPLTDAESAQVLAGWAIYQGNIPAAGGYSPLLASLNALAFVLFGALEGSARLASVLLGMVVVLLPWGLKRQLGRVGMMIASVLLAFSAAGLFLSRTVNADIVAAAGVMLLLVGGVWWLAENRPAGAYLSAGGLMLLLTGGTAGFTALAASLLLLLVLMLTNRTAFTAFKTQVFRNLTLLKQAALVCLGLLAIVATAATFNLTGLAAISEQFTGWLGQLNLQPQAGAGYPILFNLLFSEPLLVVFGGIGLISVLWRSHPLGWVLALWTVLVIVLDTLMGGRSGGQVILAVIPLSLLAGWQLGNWGEAWQAHASLEREGVFVAISLMVSVFGFVSLTTWIKCSAAQAGCNTAWILPLAGVLLIVGLAILFAVWYGKETAWRGLALVLLVVLGILSIGDSWRLSYAPPNDAPFQLLSSLTASSRLVPLMTEIRRQSAERTGDPHDIDIAVVDLDTPSLRWQLRNFGKTRFVTDFVSANGASVILARPNTDTLPEGAYVGQAFATAGYWSPNTVEGKDWFGWYLYRTLPNHIPGSDQVVLWVKAG